MTALETAANQTQAANDPIEIIAFYLGEQQFCVRTTSIREIRGWAKSTPLPHASPEVMGMMNLRGAVIPVINTGRKLGHGWSEPTERSAIVVAELGGAVFGLMVDRVSDILTIDQSLVQPVPEMTSGFDKSYVEGIIAHQGDMICFLNLGRMFPEPSRSDFFD
ncbi:chemotaxis protein CheW [Jiella sp. MQZ9-1]|uniref:Purine-binding chemotaxis protein CheW n=1 Tax=Jiella flava TaxID=2816857 RepID=A0A939FYT5_9HYPH|nr:chemotaxis protein CheW [Jiella flava]MBO0663369.1 purine-binding chemotaxis protein CheW [Jiella flava]MCD2471945.1 chemotaxis protein CheW [Jiella flava]